MTSEQEILCLAIEDARAQMVVELGSWTGDTAKAMASAAAPYGGVVVTIDTFDFSKSVLSGPSNLIFLCGKSEDIGLLWRNPIDVLFVDSAPYKEGTHPITGIHTGEQITKELDVWAEHVRGSIFFHDTISYVGTKDAIVRWYLDHQDDWDAPVELFPGWPGLAKMSRRDVAQRSA